MPAIIKKRVSALKNLQKEHVDIEKSFSKEFRDLEIKYSHLFQVNNDKRTEIVAGTKEPTDLECEFDSDSCCGDDDCESCELEPSNVDENATGIPDFWLMVLQNADYTNDIIHECDIPILKYLIDIKCVLNGKEEEGFELEFYFAKNEFFTNKKLTKKYYFAINTDGNPLEYNGLEMARTVGCKIDWCDDKKLDQDDSFFNFFNPTTVSMDQEEDISPDDYEKLNLDFDIAAYIREKIIPRAVLYYTGECVMHDEDYDDSEDDDDDSEEEDDDDN